MIGISLRYALAAGLHLRNEDPLITLDQKRARSQTWWALHSIECVLTSITGRPRTIQRKDCTVPLPNLLMQETSDSLAPWHGSLPQRMEPAPIGLASGKGKTPATIEKTLNILDVYSFSEAWTQLDLLQHKTLSILYAARTAVQPWKQIQDVIASLTSELDAWASRALPSTPVDLPSPAEPRTSRERSLLFLYYQSAKICITRPCLCRLDRRVKGQSEDSANFNHKTASTCVQAALDLTAWLFEPADAQWIYKEGPWWAGVHISKFLF